MEQNQTPQNNSSESTSVASRIEEWYQITPKKEILEKIYDNITVSGGNQQEAMYKALMLNIDLIVAATFSGEFKRVPSPHVKPSS